MKKFLILVVPIFIVGILFAAPLNEGFESSNCPASDWTIKYANPSPPSGNLMTHTTDYYYEGSRSFRFSSFSSGSPYDQYLITPQLVVTAGDQTVSFYYRRYTYGSETFRVGWSSTGTEITDFTWSSDITDASTTWQQYSKNDLPVGTKYVAIHYKSDYAYYLYIDTFVGPEKWTPSTPPNPATNPSPVNAATNVPKNVTLSWSSGGGSPTDYKIFWGISETSFENEQSGLTTTSFSPPNLQYSTTYYWKVDPHNDYGYASDIATLPVWSFTTMDDPTIYPPFTEGFEHSGSLPNGWTVTHGSGGSYNWECVTSDSHGASSAYNGSYFARLNVYNSSTTYNPYCLITPPIDLSSGNIRLNYWVWIGSAGLSTPLDIEISIDNMATWTVLYQHTLTTTDTWFNNTVALTDYTSSGAYIRFKGTSNYGSGSCNLGLDDITFEPIPEEPIITVNPESWDFGTVVLGSSATKQFTISNTGAGKLMINSVETAGDYYSIISSPTDTELEAGENTNFTVKYEPGAESKGTHQGSVVILYGDGGEKIIPLTGTCVDATIYEADLPYTENFDGTWSGNPPAPLGWIVINADNDSYTWNQSNTYISPTHSGTYAAHGMGNANDYLISPPINSTDINIRLKWWDKVENASYPNKYKVLLSTTTPDIASFTVELGDFICTNATWTEHSLNLTAYSNNTFYLAFYQYYSASTYYGFGIDDFLLELAPSVIEPSNLIVSSITGNSAVLGWTENNVPSATTWDIIYGAPGFNPNGKSTQIQVTSNPYTLTGLQPSTTYEWYVRAVKDGNVSPWAGPSSFTTAQIPAELPFTESFEGDINWTIVNGTQTNKWYVGTATYYEGNQSAYISNDNGVSNAYTNSTSAVVHLYRDISFPAGALEYNLSFMFNCGGESNYDGLKVFLVETSTIPAAGTQLSTGQIGNTWYNLTTPWTEKTITINNAVAGTTKRLVFSWRNDSSGGTQPPAAIDNIELTYTMPNPSPEPPSNPVPADLATAVPLNQILSWTNNGTVTKVDVYFGLSGNMVLVSENQTDPLNSYDPDIEYGQTYEWKIVTKNDAGETAEGPVWTFSTMADPTIYSLPYLNDFQSNINGWTVLDVNNDGYVWDRLTESGSNIAMKIRYNSSMAMNDWFITPPINLTKDITYDIKYEYRVESGSYPENLGVYIGNSPTPAALTTLLDDQSPLTNEEFEIGTASFTPPATGIYYIGFYGYSDADMFNLYVDNFRITLAGSDIVSGITSGGTATPDPAPIDNPVTGEPLDTSLTITGITGTPIITVITEWAPPAVQLPNVGLSFVLSGTTFSGTTITINHNLGFIPEQIAYRIEPGTWNILTSSSDEVIAWNSTLVTFTLSAKADGDLGVVFPQQEGDTLPVTLSNFTAVVTSENFVNIAWLAETETNHSGYNILRNEAKDLENAIKINAQLIDQGTVVGTQISYFYTDFEVYTNQVYYYWLESIALDGTNQFYGPLTVIIGDPTQEPLPPVVPMVTKLYNAFPNPFNPNTNIRYSLKEAGKVKIEIYNMKGQKIKSYNQEHSSPGYYQVSWDGRDENGRNVASGIYLYRLTTANYTSAKKMVLAK